VDQAFYFQLLCAKIQQQAHCVLSRPFACPESGKRAVKVINHYGDEVLEVFEV
jgi:adenine-specific DNA-methyltransferase